MSSTFFIVWQQKKKIKIEFVKYETEANFGLWKSSYSIRTYRTQSSTQNILDEFIQLDRKECKDALQCYLTAANTGLKPEGEAADVPVTEPQVPQPDEGVVATGEQLSWRLKHHVQHTCSSTELGAKRTHTLGPGQGTGPARDIKDCFDIYKQNGITFKFNVGIKRAAWLFIVQLLSRHIRQHCPSGFYSHMEPKSWTRTGLNTYTQHTQWFNQLFYYFFLTTPTSKIKN